MAGTSNTQIQTAFVAETTAGVTPATPAFKRPSGMLTVKTERPTDAINTIAARGQTSAIARGAPEISGSFGGRLLYGEFDEFFASLFQNSWASDVLVNGESQQTLTIEEMIPLTNDTYSRYRGCDVSGGSLTFNATETAAQVSFDFLGMGEDAPSTTPISGATYQDPSEFVVLGNRGDLGTITMSGFDPIDCMSEASIAFSYEGKERQPRLCSDDDCGITAGAMMVQITGKFYVEDGFLAVKNAAKSGVEFALTIPMGGETGKKYLLELPRCQFTQSSLDKGETGAAYQDFTIKALFDATLDGTAKLTRAVA